MSTAGWHLAQLNVAKAKWPLDSAEMAPFMDNLDRINTLGDDSPGAVWRYQDESGGATDTRVEGHPDTLVNLTVWESADALFEYAYRTEHVEFLRKRREWFEAPGDDPYLVLWWVPAGTRPSPEEAMERLAHLAAHGPSAEAFTFRHRFDPPES